MARRFNAEDVREAIREVVHSHPIEEDLPSDSGDSTFSPSDSSDDESVGSNSVSEDLSVTLGSETRSASSTDTDLGGFIVRDEHATLDDASSPYGSAHATAVERTERLEREVAAILAMLRRR
jgi:hypothetical protein